MAEPMWPFKVEPGRLASIGVNPVSPARSGRWVWWHGRGYGALDTQCSASGRGPLGDGNSPTAI